VNPARAMGLFLRTWRGEWAGFSRGRLAIAVNGRLDGHGRVTERVVQKWEEGQPPASSDELVALCRVMQQNGLTPPEVEQFRQAVLVGCSAHHYPELFLDDDVAYRDDIEQVAEALRWALIDDGGATNVVRLVAYAKDLEAAVLAREARPGNGPQARRQRAALAWLWCAIAWRHYSAGRMVQAARLATANAEHVALHFGARGIRPDLTPFTERLLGVMAMHDAGQDRPARLVWVQRALELSRESAAGGDERSALKALRIPLGDTWVLAREEAARLLEVGGLLAERYHELHGDEGLVWSEGLLGASIRLGLIDRAESHVADLERLKVFRGQRPRMYRKWLYGAGDWARHCGDLRDATDYYTAALDVDRSAGLFAGVQRATFELQRCERARSRERTISIGKGAIGAGRQA